MMNYKKKTMKVGEKLKIVWKKILIVNQYTMKNIQNLKLKRYWRYFHDIKRPKKGSQFICLSVTLINFVFSMGKNYYPQAFLEECKHVVKKKKVS